MSLKILGFDASGPGLSAGYLIGGEAAADFTWRLPKTAGSHLVPWLDMLAREFGEPDAVAVGVGPGSFTGVRIAVTAAKALAYAWDVPVLGISSLQAWAYSAPNPLRHVLVTSEKRGPAFYAGLYFCGAGVPEAVIPDWAASGNLPEAFPWRGPIGVLGPLGLDAGWLAAVGPEATALNFPLLGSQVARLAQSRVQCGEWEDALNLSPAYIRAPAISNSGRSGSLAHGKEESRHGSE